MTSLIGLGVGAALSAGVTAAKGGSIKDILKSAAIGGGTGLVTAGVGSAVGGSVAGLVGSGISKIGTAMGGQAANAAAQTGGQAAVQAGTNAITNTATTTVTEGVKSTLATKIGGSLLNIGGKMQNFGAAHGVSGTISKVSAKVAGPAPTGPTTGNTGAAVVNGQSANPSLLNTGNTHSFGGNMAQQAGNTATTKAPVPGTAGNTVNPTTATASAPPQLKPYANIKSSGGAGTFKANVGKVAGQVGVQGGLSLISAGMAAKQAKAANDISQQSLLFQQQSYNEQKAEKESFKSSMKQTAKTSYDSALLFGSTLQGSDANNTLLTSYDTQSTGNYSILTYSSSRNRDRT